jgi:hypothetical protein
MNSKGNRQNEEIAERKTWLWSGRRPQSDDYRTKKWPKKPFEETSWRDLGRRIRTQTLQLGGKITNVID